MSQAGELNATSAPGVVDFLQGNTGGPVGPDGSNVISVVGSGSVSVAGNPGTHTLTITTSGGSTPSLSPYIVGKTGTNDFSTIQAGINAAMTAGASATNPIHVYIKPGTYNENLTLFDGVYLIGFSPFGDAAWNATGGINIEPAVIVTGSISTDYSLLSSSPANYIKDIYFNPASGNVCNLIGAPGFDMFIRFDGCILLCNDASLIFSCTNGPIVYASNSFITAPTAGFATSTDGLGIQFIAFSSTIAMSASQTISSPDVIALNLQSCVWEGTSLNITATSGSLSVFALDSTFQAFSTPTLFITTHSAVSCSFRGTNCTYSAISLLNIANTSPDILFAECNFGETDPQTMITAAAYTLTNSTGALGTQVFKGNNTGYSSSLSYKAQSSVQTTNATITTIATIAVPTNKSIVIEGRVIGQNSAHTDATGGWFMAVAQNNGGSLALVGSATTTVKASSTGTFTVTTSGTNLLVRVTGIAVTTYNWTTVYDYEFMATNS